MLRAVPTSRSALLTSTNACRSRPGSVAVRPMRPRRCVSSPRRTRSRATDPDLYAAARATGADVPVCLDPRPRIMRGIGEILSAPFVLPPLPALLVNPGVALPTKAVFAAWKPAAAPPAPLDVAAISNLTSAGELLHLLAMQANDLEAPAIVLQPVIAEVLTALRGLPGCRLARMSGSGATCFALFSTIRRSGGGGKAVVDQTAVLVGQGDRARRVTANASARCRNRRLRRAPTSSASRGIKPARRGRWRRSDRRGRSCLRARGAWS